MDVGTNDESPDTGELKYKALVENSFDSIVILDACLCFSYVTVSAERMLGWPAEELLGTRFEQHLHDEDRERFAAMVAETKCTDACKCEIALQIMHKNGSRAYVAARVTNSLDKPYIKGYIVNLKDVTDRQITKQQWEFNRRNLDALINSAPGLVWSIDTAYKLITANRAFVETIRSLAGLELKAGDSVLLPQLADHDMDQWKSWYDRALAGEQYIFEHYEPYFTSWAEISFNPIIENGKVVGAACFSADITERKRSTELLRHSERMMAEAQQMAGFGSWELDLLNPSLYENELRWSDEVYRLMGYAPQGIDINPDAFFKIVHPDDVAPLSTNFKTAIEGGTRFSAIHRIITPAGQVKWMKEDAGTVPDEATGKPVKVIGMVHDITERKKAEEEREKITADLRQRNEHLEQFTFIVSHNLRAPLANIKAFTEELKDNSLDAEHRQLFLEELSASVAKLDDVLKDLNQILQVNNQITLKKEVVSFADLVRSIEKSISQFISQHEVTITTDFDDVPELTTLKTYLHSIFYNLISNGIKYHREGVPPVIHISSRKAGNKVLLRFTDNGTGIDMARNGAAIFGLYKRFHRHIAGKGLGLFMTKKQVESLGGTIEVESEIDKGTSFIISLER